MIVINKDEWFDLDLCAIGLTISSSIFVFFLKIDTYWQYLLLLALIVCLVLFYRKIQSNKNINIHVNKQQWYVEWQGQLWPVILKDYWRGSKFLCISLRGSEKSISLLVRRSIIGQEKFSQLHAIIT